MTPFNFIPGNSYVVTFGNGAANFTLNGKKVALAFNKSFPCYDARYHGVANPDDYIRYEFQLPGQLGVWSAYNFQIIDVFSY